MQRVTIIGRVAKKPENNNGVIKFSVAVNEKYNGNETTEWFNCVAFKKAGEVLEKYLDKGSKVFISGKQSTNEYEGKRYTSLIVNDFEFLDSKSTSANTAQVDGVKQAEINNPDVDFDQDIPF